MSYVKTKKLITASGRKRILAVGYETRELGLKAGDTVIAYLARPEDELELDTILAGAGKQYYIVFSDTTDAARWAWEHTTRRIRFYEQDGTPADGLVVREWAELGILGAIILLRGVLTFLIHWEIRNEKKEEEEKRGKIAEESSGK